MEEAADEAWLPFAEEVLSVPVEEEHAAMAKAKIEHKAAEAVFFIKFSFPGFSSREAVSKKKASFHKRKDADCAVPPYFPGIQPGHFILNADHGGD